MPIENITIEDLKKARYRIAIFSNGILLWTNDTNRVWIKLLEDLEFNAKFRWEGNSFIVSLMASNDCTVDEVRFDFYQGRKLLFSRVHPLNPIKLSSLDTLVLEVVFGEVKN